MRNVQTGEAVEGGGVVFDGLVGGCGVEGGRCGGRGAVGRAGLALEAGEGDGADEVFLDDEEDYQRRDGDENGAGHDGLVVGAAEAVGHAGE